MSFWRRDWAKIRPNTFTGWLLRLPLRILPKQTILPILSGTSRGMKWILAGGIYSCWFGTYELEKQISLQRFVKPGMTVFDIGANSGFYTLLFSRLVQKNGTVCAFEPFADNVQRLLLHIKLNRLRNVSLLQLALKDSTEIVGFHVEDRHPEGSICVDSKYKVAATSLDKLILDTVVPVPDLIKIDAEGAEALILLGAKSILQRRKTIVFVALHGEEQSRACASFLASLDYELFLLDGTKMDKHNISSDEIYALPREMSQGQ